MISNSDLFFSIAKEFQDARKKISDTYKGRMRFLERTKGSEYFTEESKKAEEEKKAAAAALREQYASRLYTAIEAMELVNNNRKAIPPTEEELRLIQLLKMKDSLTENELHEAAMTLKGNPSCLAILSELSRKNGYWQGYDSYYESDKMSKETTLRIIQRIKDNMRDFLETENNAAVQRVIENRNNLYGVDPNAAPIPERRIFETKAECYEELAHLSPDSLPAFTAAVDE